MPQLPEVIWKRRLESEFDEMKKSGVAFNVNEEKTDYRLRFVGEGVENSGNEIKKRFTHEVRILLRREFPYAGGVEVYWTTPIFHPNISKEGLVCIQLLKLWSPSVSVKNIADGLKQLLENPNPKDPLNKEAAEYFISLEKGTPKSIERKPRIV
ncbi:hypothetical protein HY991_01310 [Candidatus Micrarchaeota archaeon]|nr:hypothetical protein [Candidatus Micrarchaeota archaeon]